MASPFVQTHGYIETVDAQECRFDSLALVVKHECFLNVFAKGV